MRKKLLGRQAYGRYQDGKKSGKFEASKPLPRKGRVNDGSDDDDSEHEGKGKRLNKSKKSQKITASSETAAGQIDVVDPLPSAKKSKKRPGSYLDQLLAERTNKKSKSKT